VHADETGAAGDEDAAHRYPAHPESARSFAYFMKLAKQPIAM